MHLFKRYPTVATFVLTFLMLLFVPLTGLCIMSFLLFAPIATIIITLGWFSVALVLGVMIYAIITIIRDPQNMQPAKPVIMPHRQPNAITEEYINQQVAMLYNPEWNEMPTM